MKLYKHPPKNLPPFFFRIYFSDSPEYCNSGPATFCYRSGTKNLVSTISDESQRFNEKNVRKYERV